jgi:hypothetical protein
LHNQGPFTAPKNTRKESADTQDESYHRKRRRVAAPFAAPKKRGLNTRDREGVDKRRGSQLRRPAAASKRGRESIYEGVTSPARKVARMTGRADRQRRRTA